VHRGGRAAVRGRSRAVSVRGASGKLAAARIHSDSPGHAAQLPSAARLLLVGAEHQRFYGAPDCRWQAETETVATRACEFLPRSIWLTSAAPRGARRPRWRLARSARGRSAARLLRTASTSGAALAFYTGLRRAEIYRLRWEDVELDGYRLVVRKSKSVAGTGRRRRSQNHCARSSAPHRCGTAPGRATRYPSCR
jgi:integrase